jgi:NAD(P)-dependent dehydrogenase (short-subunit alcohol dehydrogenase family)
MDVRQMFDLKGRVALVTGGSIGLGRQVAQALAEMGADVILCARKRERCEQTAAELRTLGARTLALACDVTNLDQVQEAVRATLAEFSRIDILVNNAGISWGAPLEEMRLADWHQVLETNVTGTFLFTQAVGKTMIAQRQGKIINMASVAGLGGAPSEVVQATAYHASKGAVIAMTKDLACKWAEYNIQVNAIAPGWFPTHMSDWVIRHKKDMLLRSIPLGRFGSEDDLKGAAVFLASDASAYITGHVLVVDGGQSVW